MWEECRKNTSACNFQLPIRPKVDSPIYSWCCCCAIASWSFKWCRHYLWWPIKPLTKTAKQVLAVDQIQLSNTTFMIKAWAKYQSTFGDEYTQTYGRTFKGDKIYHLASATQPGKLRCLNDSWNSTLRLTACSLPKNWYIFKDADIDYSNWNLIGVGLDVKTLMTSLND